MKTKEVSKVLKKEAVKLGLCVAWTNSWGSPTKEQMADMYIEGLDFCILNNYPSNEFIKEHFGAIAESKGVFTDTKVNLVNPDIAILNGNCSGKIELTGFASRDIHVRHNSKVKVIIRDNAKAFIRVYNNAHVIVENLTQGKSYLYFRGGGTATISGKVKTRNYELKDGDWKTI
ncbi:hypothetical protein [Dysgonomonas sp. 25]|uniref:hypothetical protein n=1 Tax=Dysgonomonas sp. 25 TaxID=2302933 RepID=UPI0013D04C2A|nr:hypothetical protein [Dysgonomonas sp. 25]NDV68592.1 hypothetical protein [Dysgonomonas sp. 25]